MPNMYCNEVEVRSPITSWIVAVISKQLHSSGKNYPLTKEHDSTCFYKDMATFHRLHDESSIPHDAMIVCMVSLLSLY